MEKATFAGGCFWCTEALFKRLKGVSSVTPGYTGGTTKNPRYEDVSLGSTGHAEAILVEFDSKIISYKKLVTIFFHLHDPTTLNRQGNDNGTQYRSAIFCHTPFQKREALGVRELLDDGHVFRNPIVTEVEMLTQFYPAEDIQKDYYVKNSYQPYCQYVIDPKVAKLLKDYGTEVKDEYKKK